MTDTLLPGMAIGAIVRVFLIPGPRLFRLFAAALLLPLGIWLCLHTRPPQSAKSRCVVRLGLHRIA
jgi:hypothetical protein